MTPNVNRKETWLVLGGSSSVARAFARAAAEDGADIILAGRDMDDMARTAEDISIRTGRDVDVVAFDAEGISGHAAFVTDVTRRAGFLNVFLAFGAMPEQDEETAEQTFTPYRSTPGATPISPPMMSAT